MLYNKEYFNQKIMKNKKIQELLAKYTKGVDLESIIKLVNDNINEKHSQEEVFADTINGPEMEIYYEHSPVQYNAAWVCDEWAKEKKSIIKINYGGLSLSIAGDRFRLQLRRNDENGKFSLNVELVSGGKLQIEQKEEITAKKNPTRKRNRTQN